MSQYHAKLNDLLEEIFSAADVDPDDEDALVLELWSLILRRGFEAEILGPLLRDYVRERRRAKVRALERPPRQTKIVATEGISKDDPLTPAQKRMKEYLGQVMYFGGKYVVIATATKADWQRRRKMLGSLRDALDLSVETHDKIIELFDTYDAARTEDIPIDALTSAMYGLPSAQSQSA